MVSIMPYNESRNLRFMFDLTDLHEKTTTSACPNSIYDYLSKNNEKFSSFLKILEISEMQKLLDEPQFDSTIFVPINSGIDNDLMLGMNQNLAKAIVNFSILGRVIDKDLVIGTPASYFLTKYEPLRKLLVTNISGVTQLNGCSNVIEYNLSLRNGMIHVVDRVLIPRTII
jgi:hypothetical protein